MHSKQRNKNKNNHNSAMNAPVRDAMCRNTSHHVVFFRDSIHSVRVFRRFKIVHTKWYRNNPTNNTTCRPVATTMIPSATTLNQYDVPSNAVVARSDDSTTCIDAKITPRYTTSSSSHAKFLEKN